MSQLGRYWIFFVIVAVGLALSWGQVGRKTQRALEAEPVVYLSTETPCRPRVAPCAAVGADRALVLGPDAAGLRILQTGLRVADIVRLEAVFLAADGSALGERLPVRGADAWRLTQLPAGSVLLRLRLVGNGEVSVAEFPL